MRKYAIPALIAMLCSCGSHREQYTTDNISEDKGIFQRGDSSEFMDKESLTYIEDIDNDSCERVLAKADTFFLKNGIRAIHIFGFAPQNECIIFTDSKRRPMTVYSRASETDAQILVFSYAPGGRLKNVKESYTDIIDLPGTPESLLASIHKNEVAFEYSFIYNEEESLTEIRRKSPKPVSEGSGRTVDVIRSSSGTHLEGEFRPVEYYWASDLHGGRLDMYCKEVSDSDTNKNDTLRKWINFQAVSDFDVSSAVTEEFFGNPTPVSF